MESFIFALFGFGALTYVFSGAFGDSEKDNNEPQNDLEIEGTDGDDYMEVADLIEIDARYDISLNGGDDTIIGSSSIDALMAGGTGDDELRARGNDLAVGGSGSDFLEGTGNSTISGGEGSDILHAFDATHAFGGAGNDLLRVYDTEAGSVVDGGEGDDTVVLSSGEEGAGDLPRIVLGEGRDSVILSPDLFSSVGTNQSVLVEDFNPDEDELVVDIVREGRFAPEVLEHLKGVELLEDENASYTDVIASFGPPGEEEANNRFTIRLAGVSGFSLEQIHLMDAGFGGIEGIADADRFSGVMGSQEVGSGEQRYVVITDAEIDSSGLPSSPIAFIGPGDQSLDVDLSSDENSSLVHMGAGADSVNVVSGEGTIFGGEGNDTLNSSLSSGAVLLNGGRGNDIAILRMGHQFRGGEGNDDVFLMLEPEDLDSGEPALIGGIGQGEITISYAGASQGDLTVFEDENASTGDLRVVDIFVQDHLVAKFHERRTSTGADENPISGRITLADR